MSDKSILSRAEKERRLKSLISADPSVGRAVDSLIATKRPQQPSTSISKSPLRLSMIFFADASDRAVNDQYALAKDLAQFADQHGFEAVWLPERHFHSFGGAYPNPAVMASVLAQLTSRVRIRAGSVVLPLHHPLEVVEQWGMIDNMSGGRVDLGFASG